MDMDIGMDMIGCDDTSRVHHINLCLKHVMTFDLDVMTAPSSNDGVNPSRDIDMNMP